jgi:hypothetical protein
MIENGRTDDIDSTEPPISPWTYRVSLASGDGSFTAAFEYESEVCQGGPTYGRVVLSNGITFESCNASFVWSDDSKYLAVPQWTRYREQRLLLINAESRTSELLPEVFQVLELHTFKDGVVEGIDSPVYKPKRVSIKTRP